jgi:hypothetical protein
MQNQNNSLNMKKILFAILLLFSFSINAQHNKNEIKKDALQILKKINFEYKNGSLTTEQISELFCEKIYCSVCDIEDYDDDYLIQNQKILKNFKKIAAFLNLRKLKKSRITYDEERKEYTLSYQLVRPTAKFEGSSALFSFILENGKLKLNSIQTIP